MFRKFLNNLGFSQDEIHKGLKNSQFEYSIHQDKLSVKYVIVSGESDIYDSHKRLWNKNLDPVFVAVSEKKTYLINAKEKPDKEKPLKKSICIESFDYGLNSKGYENIDDLVFSKSAIDAAYFFEYVCKHRRKNNRTVDKDLLLNLLELKSDLVKNGNDQIIHLLILRCLFIKYLEDRGIFNENYLLDVLESRDPQQLIAAFEKVARINGDIFKYDAEFDGSQIETVYLHKLSLFFKTDYKSGQFSLFPYQFDNIPIQLISHVYEAFLKSSTKKGDGIYYTPDFLVDFMLSQSFDEKLKNNPKSTILDPAVGSGAFLVQAFQMIQKSYGRGLDYEEKKRILQTQLFGIDIDRNALQIAAFSLYLALLEEESSDFIREKIEQENPILPSLIGETLIAGNTILEDLFTDKVFDCIASNPPWGSVPIGSSDPKVNQVYLQERAAIDNKSGEYPEYSYVADYERSQAFITRVSKWGGLNTVYVMVVKNSIFLNDKTLDFRKDILEKYQIKTFYELSHYNEILFKKSVIGNVQGQQVEVGASEPCVVLIFRNKTTEDNTLRYISPKLTEFARHFELIHYTSSDLFELKQAEFIEYDSLWKVLVNSDLEAHDLIVNKLLKQKKLKVDARRGLQPKGEMKPKGAPIWKQIITPQDFVQYQIISDLELFNWNQDLHRAREESVFRGERIVFPIGPTKQDGYLLRGLFLKEEVLFKDNMISIKLSDCNDNIGNYSPQLGVFNSQLIGFIIYQLSVQWGKGKTWVNLRNEDIENLPFKVIGDTKVADEMTQLVHRIQNKKTKGSDFESEILHLNELVFDLYGLLEYEKEIIREFYEVRVNRAGKNDLTVLPSDINAYWIAFKDAYSLLLSKNKTINASYHISKNLGVVICISITDKENETELLKNPQLSIVNFVKGQQLAITDSIRILFEEKVKIYDKEQGKFYIIKSNQFKDWTIRQAMKDAKEEIEAFINYLPA
ncbi:MULTISPECIES: N-6 DNA methylase [unclassified Algoriphagus]|uniref:HsdM family class I SAM-dependent methyltransferase n=1 Tax=unclassified Algoriphagus TaxID=2641541 RepID=UPI001C63773D|nr:MULTISPECIES: N-6 DNA methylase [unclassified Algoriphagus]QYH39193.1 N-6 DNA methylase [Algoriphagus sp. NBT04N3]